jgi:hypothetical protein
MNRSADVEVGQTVLGMGFPLPHPLRYPSRSQFLADCIMVGTSSKMTGKECLDAIQDGFDTQGRNEPNFYLQNLAKQIVKLLIWVFFIFRYL